MKHFSIKLVLFVAVLLALPFGLKAQVPIDGAHFGVIVSDGDGPTLAWGVRNSFSIEKIGGELFHFVEASFLRSKRGFRSQPELYVARLFTGREVHWKKSYISLATGTWAFINTTGADHARMALASAIGYRTGPLDLHLGGELVSIDGPDLYYLSVGLVIGGL